MIYLNEQTRKLYNMSSGELERYLAEGSLSIQDCFGELLGKYHDYLKTKNPKSEELKDKIDYLFKILGKDSSTDTYRRTYSCLEREFKTSENSTKSISEQVRKTRTRKGLTFDIILIRILEIRAREKAGVVK